MAALAGSSSTFQATPPPGGTARFRLGWSGRCARAGAGRIRWITVDNTKNLSRNQAEPVSRPSGNDATNSLGIVSKRVIRTGTIRIGPTADALLRVSDRFDVRFVLTDERGRRCPGVVESSAVEACGPVRGTLLLRWGIPRIPMDPASPRLPAPRVRLCRTLHGVSGTAPAGRRGHGRRPPDPWALARYRAANTSERISARRRDRRSDLGRTSVCCRSMTRPMPFRGCPRQRGRRLPDGPS